MFRYTFGHLKHFLGVGGEGGGSVCVFLLCLHKLNYSRQHISAARHQTTVLDGLMERKILEEGKSENEISLGRTYIFHRSSKQNHFLWPVEYFKDNFRLKRHICKHPTSKKKKCLLLSNKIIVLLVSGHFSLPVPTVWGRHRTLVDATVKTSSRVRHRPPPFGDHVHLISNFLFYPLTSPRFFFLFL